MGILIGIIIVAFIVGLLSRTKGDNFLDTLGSGCGTLVFIAIVIAIILLVYFNK